MTRTAYLLIGVALGGLLLVASQLFPAVEAELKSAALFAFSALGIQLPTKSSSGGKAGSVMLVLLLALAPVASGCAGVTKAIADVTKVVAEVMDWVDTIERFAVDNVYPKVSEQDAKRVATAFATVRKVAAAVDEGTATARQLHEAYTSLVMVMQPYGVHATSDRGLYGARGNSLGVPAPDKLVPLE